ncbi:MAG: acyl-CoA dehydrogenase family protein, partial [Vicinamibacteria bacterium]
GKHYVLNGTKQFITNAGFADLFVVFAKIGGEKFSALVVERGMPGVSTGQEEQKLGIRGSSTRQLILENARVPAENLLGEAGRGHKIAFNILNIGRFKLGSGAVGAAKDCLQVAVKYGIDRKQFGQPIVEFGSIQKKIADMATRIYVADSMGYRTAGLLDRAIARIAPGESDRYAKEAKVIEEYTMEASIVKVYGTECLDAVADDSLQILGGYGFIKDYPIERHYRDSRINRIFEGTNEINRLIIPGILMKRAAKGDLPFFDFIAKVNSEIEGKAPLPEKPSGPLGDERRLVERGKRLVAHAADIMVKKNLGDLKTKQQHLELLADMVIDVYAMDSTVARTMKLVRLRGENQVRPQIDMCHIFVSSAADRLRGHAFRLIDNELEGAELADAAAAITKIAPLYP